MRRMIALFVIICCLFSFTCMTCAEPAEVPVEEEAEATYEEAAVTEEPADAPVEDTAEELPQQTVEVPVSPIDGETAIETMEVTVAVDEAGRAGVSITMQMHVVGDVDELRFSVPDEASRARIMGYNTKTEKERDVRYLIIKERGGFPQSVTLNMTYTMADLVSEGEDSQILAVPLLSLQDYRVGRYTFAVSMPQTVTTVARFSSGYYSELVEDVMTVRTEENWVVGAMNEIVRDNDTLTMTLVVPQGYFVGNHGESRMPKVLSILSLVLAAVALVYWLRTLRNPPLKTRARSLPPDGVNPGDLPLLLGSADVDFNLLVSQWAVLGYLSVYVSKSGHVLLRRRMAMGNERRKVEQKLFELLFADSDVCDGASVRYKRVGEKAVQVMRRYWYKRLFEKDSGSPMLAGLVCWLACAFAANVAMDAVAPAAGRGFFLFLALVAGFAMGVLIFRCPGCYYRNNVMHTAMGVGSALLMLIIGGVGDATLTVLPCVAVTALIGWQTCHGGKRRPYGDEVIGQTLGFRRFILHTTEHHVLQMLVRDSQYFYKLLPFAEAMGQGRKFVNLFHDCKLEPCQWYDAARGVPTTATAFYDHYRDTLDLLELSMKE